VGRPLTDDDLAEDAIGIVHRGLSANAG
jgi:hypothetical protein